ncbi:regulation of response to stimulus [Branchiostoma belcheri]|nr:regulation of response to stimulus [Branchiostoma belcheri]
MAWSVVLGRCDSTEQWARFEAVGMVLRITYEPGQDRFVIDWFSTSASAHNVPSGPDPDFCNPPSERFWSGRFTTYSSFILIAENSERQVKSSFPTQCLEAWEQHDGIHLTLRRSSLKVSVMTRRQLGAPRAESLSIVATTRSSQNVDSQNTNKERVECFALNHKYKHISSFNVTATKQVDDPRCFLSETTETSTIFNRFTTTHVSNDNRTQASEKTTSSSSTNLSLGPHIQNATAEATSGSPYFSSMPTLADVTPDGVIRTDTGMTLTIILVLAGPVIAVCFLPFLLYAKRRKNNREQHRPNVPVPCQNMASLWVLQNNPMYTSVAQELSQTAESTRDDSGHSHVREEGARSPSGHHYWEIKDGDVREENYRRRDSSCDDEECEEINDGDINNESEQGNNDDPLTFYAAVADLRVPTNGGAGISLYTIDTETVGFVNFRYRLASLSVSTPFNQEETGYEMATERTCAGVSNHQGICTNQTLDDDAHGNMEEGSSREKHIERRLGTHNDENEVKLKQEQSWR